MNKSFTKRHTDLRTEALAAINTYNGPKARTLPTGEKAIDMDDSWLVIGNGNPFLRNKRDQRLHEAGKEPCWEDQPIAESWSCGEICRLADNLAKEN